MKVINQELNQIKIIAKLQFFPAKYNFKKSMLAYCTNTLVYATIVFTIFKSGTVFSLTNFNFIGIIVFITIMQINIKIL